MARAATPQQMADYRAKLADYNAARAQYQVLATPYWAQVKAKRAARFAKRHTGLIDVDRRGGYEVADFWEAIAARRENNLILDPDEFYILASKEAVQVPPDYAAEMVPFDPLVGEFRVHYAGFFDPGFGHSEAGGSGSRAVLEVRSREVPFLLGHGQTIGRLVYERLSEAPDRLYGSGVGSNYQAQTLKLSKHFRAFAL